MRLSTFFLIVNLTSGTINNTRNPIDVNVLFLLERLVQKQPSYTCNCFGICNNVFDALLGAYGQCLKDLAQIVKPARYRCPVCPFARNALPQSHRCNGVL